MRRKLRPIAVTAVAVAGMAVLSACDPPQPWSSRLVSVNGAATDAGNNRSDRGVISPDGTKVAFESWASDLGPQDANSDYDIYLRDLTTGTTELVSVNASGTDSADGRSVAPQFSPDGTKVLFQSQANDLVAGDTAFRDIFIRDLATDVTTRVSVDPTGAQLGHALEPAFHPDGSAVAFSTDTGGGRGDAYVRSLLTGEVTRVSVDVAGTGGGNRRSFNPVFSPDGTAVAFRSGATNLVPVDTNGQMTDVFLRDLATDTTTLVSANAGGTDTGNEASGSQIFSPDGTRIAFTSRASDLVPTDTNATVDVFVRDLTTQTTTLVSANAGGTDSANSHSGASTLLAFGPDGTGLVFDSHASDLGPTDTNGVPDTYYRDLLTQTTSLVSANADGSDSGNGESLPVPAKSAFGPVGRRVLFSSSADDLGPTDTNDAGDLYVRDLATGTTTLVSTNTDGTRSGNGPSHPDSDRRVTFTADGRRLTFVSAASDLVGTDTNSTSDVYVATLHSADLSVVGRAEPEPVPAGGQLTYHLKVANAGPDPADEAKVAVLLPEGTTFAGVATTAGDCTDPPPEAPRLVLCELDEVPLGDVTNITVTANVTAPPGTTLAAIAAVSSPTVDEHPNDNTKTLESTTT